MAVVAHFKIGGRNSFSVEFESPSDARQYEKNLRQLFSDDKVRMLGMEFCEKSNVNDLLMA